MSDKSNIESEPLYIPVPVIRFILDHRRRRLAAGAEAQQKQTASGSVSQAGPLADDTPPPAKTELQEYKPND